MKIGDSVRLTIDMCGFGELEAAMLHACTAVDGTVTKTAGAQRSSNSVFTNFLRDNYVILGPMGAPSMDLVEQRVPVRLENPRAPAVRPISPT